MIRKAKTENGWVAGIPAADPRITAFKGVPFAAPPVGENRWRAPQPAADWDGVRKCYTFAPISVQDVPGLDPDNLYSREWNVDPNIPMSEDCLYLNIWTPAKSADEKLPVLVWFFGGGLVVGNTAEMEFDGERIARRGVIVVSVNYRLNVFGFLCHPQLLKEQPDAPTNFGHLDQSYGVRWVKRNIAAFGGDPDNITIGGQSAGGISVCAHFASPQNAGLFQKGIIMSGMACDVYHTFRFIQSLDQALETGKRFFDFLGVKTLEEARALDAFYLRDQLQKFKGMWNTVIDGQFLTEEYDACLITGRRLPGPIMVGCTSNETGPAVPAANIDEFKAFISKTFGNTAAEEYMAIVGGDFDQAMEMTKINNVEVAARAMKQSEEAVGAEYPLYYYMFDPEMPGWDNAGTFHSSDLWFFFETLAKCWRPFVGKHYDLARQMCNYWANFIRSGDPNGLDADGSPMPTWKPMTGSEENAVRFGDKVVPYVDDQNQLLHFLVRKWREQFR